MDLDTARQVGIALVDADLVSPEVLPAAVAALGRHLADAARSAGAGHPNHDVPDVQAAVVDGYLTHLRARIVCEPQLESGERSSESRFRAIFANTGVGIAMVDMDGQVIDADGAFAAILGYTVDDFRLLSINDFVDPQDR